MKKAVLFAVITLICSFLLISCFSSNDLKTFERVEKYYLDNKEEFNSAVEYNFPQDPQTEDFDYFYRKGGEEEFIKDHFGSTRFVQKVHQHDNDHIVFYCGGKGLATSSEYSGIYYSRNDEPYGLEFDNEGYKETSPGTYDFCEIKGVHETITTRIDENWFYYHTIYH